MTRRSTEAGRARDALADVPAQLAALRTMTVGDLREKYRDVFGEPSRSRNRDYLRRKIAWRIQELAEGGLSARADEDQGAGKGRAGPVAAHEGATRGRRRRPRRAGTPTARPAASGGG